MTKKCKVLYQEVNLEWHEHREKSSKFLINHEKTPYAKLNKIIKGKQVRNGRKRRNNLLIASSTKWSNQLKQFVVKSQHIV